MRQALEALDGLSEPYDVLKAQNALRAAIEQSEKQEPVAWIYPEALEALKSGRPWTAYGSSGDGRIPLYLNDAVARRVEPPAAESGAGFESLPASPTWCDDLVPQMRREWQGLTDEEIATVKHLYDWTAGWTIDRFARAIEAKLKERNT